MDGFFGIGFGELVMIAIVALIVLGPERLPGALREVAKFIRMVRNLSREFTDQFGDEFKALEELNPRRLLQDAINDIDEEEKAKEEGVKPAVKKNTTTSTKPSTTKASSPPKPAAAKNTTAKPTTVAAAKSATTTTSSEVASSKTGANTDESAANAAGVVAAGGANGAVDSAQPSTSQAGGEQQDGEDTEPNHRIAPPELTADADALPASSSPHNSSTEQQTAADNPPSTTEQPLVSAEHIAQSNGHVSSAASTSEPAAANGTAQPVVSAQRSADEGVNGLNDTPVVVDESVITGDSVEDEEKGS